MRTIPFGLIHRALLASAVLVGALFLASTSPVQAQATQVVLNEVHYDQASGESEFVELLAISGPVNVTGWQVLDQDEMTYTLGTSPCAGTMTLNAGDRVVIWQGSGTSVCTGTVRQIFLNRATFLQSGGDDVVLRDGSTACKDYVQYENAVTVNTKPADCVWNGTGATNPTNGNTVGRSISRKDNPFPVADTDTVADWERSGTTNTIAPKTPGAPNVAPPDQDGDGVADATDNCPAVSNANQLNTDGVNDGGDACDTDDDNDGALDGSDNCPLIANPGQEDSNSNGIGNACEVQTSGLFINEVLYEQGSGEQEFIELFAAQGPVNIQGWIIADQDEMTYTFGTAPCAGAISVNPGDRIMIYQGSGTSVCTGTLRKIYLNRGTFLQSTGDDLVLKNASNACRDYVAFENGSAVNAKPADCLFTGPNPTNGDTGGRSISRFDVPFTDNNTGADWERSGNTTTTGPKSPEIKNVPIVDTDGDGIQDPADNCPSVSNADQVNTDGANDGGNACDTDDDNDGVLDGADNCPLVVNVDQAAHDGDGTGDACDTDDDGDGVLDGADNCPIVANPDQAAHDADGTGDACDADDDNDTVLDGADNCPIVANQDQINTDADLTGDACDTCTDADADGFGDPGFAGNTCPVDNCPGIFNSDQLNSDGANDGGNVCDTDDDNDGVLDGNDNCPINSNFDQANNDNDANGGDACDTDDDNDGILDANDNCPLSSTPDQTDTDNDGQGNVCDNDDDGDGVLDGVDNCPLVANADQAFHDSDGTGDACDTDDDADGHADGADNCPIDFNSDQANADADAFGDVCDTCMNDAANDSDGDGFCADVDNCPVTANAGQEDFDNDGKGDACDNCPQNSNADQADGDNDGVGTTCDNCPADSNSNQLDVDLDGLGDVCDGDDDQDGVLDASDNCPLIANPAQENLDHDGLGDVCDPDRDGDTKPNGSDNCPDYWNPDQTDVDSDGQGNVCDNDADNDGISNAGDNCPYNANPGREDLDGDGFGDPCDSDRDGDGVANGSDNCPDNANPLQENADNDAFGDVCDLDNDSDGVPDASDNCPNVSNANQLNTDGDSFGNACDPDDDNDGLADGSDNCPVNSNAGQEDGDSDGAGNACDICPSESPNDSDNDGYCVGAGFNSPKLGDNDNCPGLSNPTQANMDGDGFGDQCDNDIDGDGHPNVTDNCPVNPNNSQADTDNDGQGNVCDFDDDGDGVTDVNDNCDLVANPSQGDTDGDGIGNACDVDADNDGIIDSLDNCPSVINPGQQDADNDDVGDACDTCPGDIDTDNDGVCDATDNCDTVANADQADSNGNGVGNACEVASGTVLINEVQYDQSGTTGEFIELYAPSGSPANISGWRLTDNDAPSGTSFSITFATSDIQFPCGPNPFILQPGDRLVIHQGSGTSVCTGASRAIFLGRAVFLAGAGDDLALFDNTNACRDYVVFEGGAQVGAVPAGCGWSGVGTSNGDTVGKSISRFDSPPLVDSNTKNDWEPSGTTTTTGPTSTGQVNVQATADTDGDGVLNANDNCPNVSNPAQFNSDADVFGDACDNCPAISNPTQANADGDLLGDVCDACPNDAANDADGDTVCGGVDNCPANANTNQANADGDAFGDVCDSCALDAQNDIDGDGICAGDAFAAPKVGKNDNCPNNANANQADSDGDGLGNVCDIVVLSGVFLNEVHYDQASGEQEFVELYAASNTDMTGWTLVDQDQFSLTFNASDPKFTCPVPFNVSTGDRIMVYSGNGTSVCAGTLRKLYTNFGTFLQSGGDDLVLRNSTNQCRDYVAFESSATVNTKPADCLWTGPNPSNGNTTGKSISRFDQAPYSDNDAGADWEASGTTTTTGTKSPEAQNVTGGGGGPGTPHTIDISLVTQDIRSDAPSLAQHGQQSAARIGRRGSVRYRTLAWFPLTGIPANANITSVKLVFHTTSGDPGNLNMNGDTPPDGTGPLNVQVQELLRQWNYDEPLTYPADFGDNELPINTGMTSWASSLHPTTWTTSGANAISDSGPSLATTVVTTALDTKFEFSSSGMADAVQRWVSGTATNHGFMLRGIDADENAAIDSRRVFCGKGFPLETTTGLSQPVAESHRPSVHIEYTTP